MADNHRRSRRQSGDIAMLINGRHYYSRITFWYGGRWRQLHYNFHYLTQ